MATLDTTQFDYALKTLYTQESILNVVYKDQPPLAMVPKWERFKGKNFVEAVVYTNSLGQAPTFSIAQQNKAPAQGKAFTITRVRDYALASIDGETIMASEGDEASLLAALQSEMDAALAALKRSMGISIFGDGSGQIGTIGNIGSNIITLSDPEDVTNFDDGQKLVFAASTTAALRDSGTTAEVTAVDRDAGTVTIGSTPSGVTTNDVIFTHGHYVSASNRLKMSGLAAWIPATAPSSTAFFGVDRSVDTTRLGGVRVPCAGLPLNEALTKLITRLAREGSNPDMAFVSHSRWEELTNLLGSKVQYEVTQQGEMGFRGFSVHGPRGAVKIYADVNCPSDKCYMIQSDTWKLRSLGPAPQILDKDGMSMMRESTADSYEIRIGFYGNLSTRSPGYSAVGVNFGS